MLVIGLDSGGKGQFGWCVAEATNPGRIRLRKSGIADHARQVLQHVRQYVRDPTEIAGAAIDTPLFWVANGERRADHTIRKAIMAGAGWDVMILEDGEPGSSFLRLGWLDLSVRGGW